MKNTKIKYYTAAFLALLFNFPVLATSDKPNVLFLLIDDLRVQHGNYANSPAKTPNIDAIASNGVNFHRAYSNVPVCGASRGSMLTGVRPTAKRFVAFELAQDINPEAISIAEHFKNNGYYAISLGKVFNNLGDHIDGWSEKPWRPKGNKLSGWMPEGEDESYKTNEMYEMIRFRHDYMLKESITKAYHNTNGKGPAFESADVPDNAYYTGKIGEMAIEKLKMLKEKKQPFFLAVGFKKPHLPFNAPKKYWDMYDLKEIKLAETQVQAIDAPKVLNHSWTELRGYADMPIRPKPIPNDVAKMLRHGYMASTSYTDAQIGNVMATLNELGMAENTIVVVWGDHGWSLGEHGLWAKHSLYNVANQIPMIYAGPGIPKGKVSQALVESVDIFPTLTELAGLNQLPQFQGESSLKQMLDVSSKGKKAIFYRWKTGDTIRTDRYAYSEWRKKGTNKVVARMLYDHHNDKNETVNLANSPEHKKIVSSLSEQLKAHILSTK